MFGAHIQRDSPCRAVRRLSAWPSEVTVLDSDDEKLLPLLPVDSQAASLVWIAGAFLRTRETPTVVTRHRCLSVPADRPTRDLQQLISRPRAPDTIGET